MKGTIRQIVIVMLTLVMLYACLAGSGGGFTDDGAGTSVYFRYPTGFTPAPFTFLIWVPIFLGAIALAIYQALPAQRTSIGLDRMGLAYTIALLANSLTPFVTLGASNIVVIVLFFALVAAYARFATREDNAQARRLVRVPLVLFATWALLACILNACQLVVSMGMPVNAMAGAVLFAAATCVCCWAVLRTREVGIAAVLTWAGVGIATAQADSKGAVLVIAAAAFCTGILAWHRGDWAVLRGGHRQSTRCEA